MSAGLAIATATGWTLFLWFFGAVCYFGVRRAAPPWSVAAFIAGVVLMIWGGVSAQDLSRLWSAEKPQPHRWGIEIFVALALVAKKMGVWLAR